MKTNAVIMISATTTWIITTITESWQFTTIATRESIPDHKHDDYIDNPSLSNHHRRDGDDDGEVTIKDTNDYGEVKDNDSKNDDDGDVATANTNDDGEAQDRDNRDDDDVYVAMADANDDCKA